MKHSSSSESFSSAMPAGAATAVEAARHQAEGVLAKPAVAALPAQRNPSSPGTAAQRQQEQHRQKVPAPLPIHTTRGSGAPGVHVPGLFPAQGLGKPAAPCANPLDFQANLLSSMASEVGSFQAGPDPGLVNTGSGSGSGSGRGTARGPVAAEPFLQHGASLDAPLFEPTQLTQPRPLALFLPRATQEPAFSRGSWGLDDGMPAGPTGVPAPSPVFDLNSAPASSRGTAGGTAEQSDSQPHQRVDFVPGRALGAPRLDRYASGPSGGLMGGSHLAPVSVEGTGTVSEGRAVLQHAGSSGVTMGLGQEQAGAGGMGIRAWMTRLHVRDSGDSAILSQSDRLALFEADRASGSLSGSSPRGMPRVHSLQAEAQFPQDSLVQASQLRGTHLEGSMHQGWQLKDLKPPGPPLQGSRQLMSDLKHQDAQLRSSSLRASPLLGSQQQSLQVWGSQRQGSQLQSSQSQGSQPQSSQVQGSKLWGAHLQGSQALEGAMRRRSFSEAVRPLPPKSVPWGPGIQMGGETAGAREASPGLSSVAGLAGAGLAGAGLAGAGLAGAGLAGAGLAGVGLTGAGGATDRGKEGPLVSSKPSWARGLGAQALPFSPSLPTSHSLAASQSLIGHQPPAVYGSQLPYGAYGLGAGPGLDSPMLGTGVLGLGDVGGGLGRAAVAGAEGESVRAPGVAADGAQERARAKALPAPSSATRYPGWRTVSGPVKPLQQAKPQEQRMKSPDEEGGRMSGLGGGGGSGKVPNAGGESMNMRVSGAAAETGGMRALGGEGENVRVPGAAAAAMETEGLCDQGMGGAGGVRGPAPGHTSVMGAPATLGDQPPRTASPLPGAVPISGAAPLSVQETGSSASLAARLAVGGPAGEIGLNHSALFGTGMLQSLLVWRAATELAKSHMLSPSRAAHASGGGVEVQGVQSQPLPQPLGLQAQGLHALSVSQNLQAPGVESQSPPLQGAQRGLLQRADEGREKEQHLVPLAASRRPLGAPEAHRKAGGSGETGREMRGEERGAIRGKEREELRGGMRGKERGEVRGGGGGAVRTGNSSDSSWEKGSGSGSGQGSGRYSKDGDAAFPERPLFSVLHGAKWSPHFEACGSLLRSRRAVSLGSAEVLGSLVDRDEGGEGDEGEEVEGEEEDGREKEGRGEGDEGGKEGRGRRGRQRRERGGAGLEFALQLGGRHGTDRYFFGGKGVKRGRALEDDFAVLNFAPGDVEEACDDPSEAHAQNLAGMRKSIVGGGGGQTNMTWPRKAHKIGESPPSQHQSLVLGRSPREEHGP